MKKLTKIPRGIRNNNPLNIRFVKSNEWEGRIQPEYKQDLSFEEFVTIEYGLRAAIILLYNYIVKNKRDTIRSIVLNWAPMTENDTASYISVVCNQTGFQMTETVYFHAPFLMINLVRAMAFVECGVMLSRITIFKAYLRVIMEKKVDIRWDPSKVWDSIVLNEWNDYLIDVKELKDKYLNQKS